MNFILTTNRLRNRNLIKLTFSIPPTIPPHSKTSSLTNYALVWPQSVGVCITSFRISKLYPPHAQAFDVVVVGSGPGGLVAAEYLSRDPNVSVLILEANPKSMAATGGTDAPKYAKDSGLTKFDIPAEYDLIMYNPENEDYRVDWITDACMWLGKTVGDSHWPFSASQMNAKMDENEEMHGHTDVPSPNGKWYSQEGYSIVSKGLLSLGYTENTLNTPATRNNRQQTFGHTPFTIKDGKRDSPAAAFWGPMSTRNNVQLLTEAKVDYLVRNTDGKATGVVYNGGSQVFVSDRGAVLMAAGALGTPKVLIQSGVGSNTQLDLLERIGGYVGVAQNAGRISNANVGRNLFDANLMYVTFSHPDMKSFVFDNRPSEAISQYMNESHTGAWAGAGPTLVSFESYEVQVQPMYVINPESRAHPGFDTNGNWRAYNEGDAYFGTPRDLAAMQSYVQKMVRMMKDNGATFISETGSDPAAVADFVASTGSYISYFFGGISYASHDASDMERCADEKLRVIGLDNVFVADASAMKESTVNPYGFVMYIGREAADQVKAYIFSTADKDSDTCSALEDNVDFEGDDIGSSSSSSAAGCCSICSNLNGCVAFTWTEHSGGTCWLKSGKGTIKTTSGAVSGVLKSATSCAALEDNVVEPHGVTLSAQTSDKCCSVCKATGGCKAFTWKDEDGGTCWLKGDKESTT
ncbi:PAN domain [Phytophthora infestans]|uniref:PAN domain n=1 Tax=Phytophthora infestans TaxID=4787 RepID=A0A8S9UZD0_PHYIN|nr:PAN domain [Phytophthora infestans]